MLQARLEIGNAFFPHPQHTPCRFHFKLRYFCCTSTYCVLFCYRTLPILDGVSIGLHGRVQQDLDAIAVTTPGGSDLGARARRVSAQSMPVQVTITTGRLGAVVQANPL